MKFNKKGEEGLMIFASLMLLLLILVVFGILTIIAPKEKLELKAQTVQVENSKITLLNYLRTPYETGTFQDLIIRWYYDRSLEPALVEKTKEIFSQLYGECYSLIIYDSKNKELLRFSSKKKKDLWAEQKIPLPVTISPTHNHLIIRLNPTYFYEKCNDF
ncbi:MAG: hypothetical protein KKG60_03995 [Nanoarchaeota archaeon]|nr:hypothetical protein [Nanoarchaeota archaeon]